MRFRDIWKNFVTSGMDFSISDPNYRRVYLINTFSLVMIFFITFFVFYNIFVEKNFILAIIESVVSMIGIFIITVLRRRNNIVFASYLIVIVIIVASLAIYSIKVDEYVLIFALLIPLVSCFLIEERLGFIISIFYLLGLVSIVRWTNIRHDNLFELDIYANLICGYTAMMLFIHLYEDNRKQVNARLVQANNQLQEIARRDSATGLYNKSFFNEYFPKELYRAKREGKIFVFFMFDIDYFKNYNDTYGHLKGDEVLVVISNTLVENLRRCSDSLFRLGGEEFGGILVEDDENKVLNKLKKIRQSIAELQIPHASSKVDDFLTVSLGAKIIKNYNSEDLTMTSIFSECDRALYKAKQNGRNRVEVC